MEEMLRLLIVIALLGCACIKKKFIWPIYSMLTGDLIVKFPLPLLVQKLTIVKFSIADSISWINVHIKFLKMFKNEVSGLDWALGLVSTSGILLTTNLHLN